MGLSPWSDAQHGLWGCWRQAGRQDLERGSGGGRKEEEQLQNIFPSFPHPNSKAWSDVDAGLELALCYGARHINGDAGRYPLGRAGNTGLKGISQHWVGHAVEMQSREQQRGKLILYHTSGPARRHNPLLELPMCLCSQQEQSSRTDRTKILHIQHRKLSRKGCCPPEQGRGQVCVSVSLPGRCSQHNCPKRRTLPKQRMEVLTQVVININNNNCCCY